MSGTTIAIHCVAAGLLCLLPAFGFEQGAHGRGLPDARALEADAALVDSSLYALRLVRRAGFVPVSRRRGGSLAPWGDAFLLANGDGALWRVRLGDGTAPATAQALPWPVPLDVAGFTAGAADVFAASAVHSVEAARFRVADVVVQPLGARTRLIAAHHAWRAAERCFVLRVSVLEGEREAVARGEPGLRWRTAFDTRPCLPLNTAGPRGARFEGKENGGRIVVTGDDEILLTVGDHGFDGENRAPALAQDPTASYGKLLRVRLSDGRASVVSLGHRNPQGLYVAPDASVWLAEHGPRGGDELNRIVPGANYGWPRVTYGTDYARHTWPANPAQGRHDGYTAPVYAFVPSPAISSLIAADSERFPAWRGDLLLGSLAGRTLYRLRIEDGRVVLCEPIEVGMRIRDLAYARDGRLVLWSDEGTLATLEPATLGAGEALVAQCTQCHGLVDWHRSYAAPTLAHVVDREVASVRDFAYSPALAAAGGRWTRARLDAFLADPSAAVPGTSMQFAGIADAEQRRALIDYLQTLH